MRRSFVDKLGDFARRYTRIADPRWRLDRKLFNGWTTYERTPWRHPWLKQTNITDFSHFSRQTLDGLRDHLDGSSAFEGHYAFVGNLANINYMRASGLKERGVAIDVYLNPQDHNVMSQPFWEDFDGEYSDLGSDPLNTALMAKLPRDIFRPSLDVDWYKSLRPPETNFVSWKDVLVAPDYMGDLPTFVALQKYDSLLISQSFAVGPLAKRPFIIAQSGGDMWFDPSRGDLKGHMTRRALHEAYAILVSNPITLAHARRYGLKNCLYLPFCIDETRYRPGEEPKIRNEWQQQSGGDFFVLTSMRIDNKWKGAHIALEGFARFAKKAPRARLVILGWGVDQSEAQRRISEYGIADRVLLLPIVGKARLARYLRACDVLMEQLVLGYFGASGLEAMATGLPVIMRLENAQYDALVSNGAPPVLNAEQVEDVAAHLLRLYQDPQLKKELGVKTHAWFLASHASSAVVDDYKTLMAAAALGLPIQWKRSPLACRLTRQERVYHRENLAAAPKFPNYQI